ncbi:MAG: hypothetical protein LAT81_09410 [Oceanicaulis sp.]|nr:hypothetical protein [Oceanicaulis sp.]
MTEQAERITDFDAGSRRAVHAAVKEALQSIETRFGLKVSLGALNYDEVSATCKLTLKCKEYRRPNGEVISGEQRAFELTCTQYGLKPSDFGRVIKVDGRDMTICGIHQGAKKHPIIVTPAGSVEGPLYKISADMASSQPNA